MNSTRRIPAIVGLVVVNVIPVVGVVYFGWKIHSVLLAYWLEGAVLGVLTLIQIFQAEGKDRPEDLPMMSIEGKTLEDFIGGSRRKIASKLLFIYGIGWFVAGGFILLFPAIFAEYDVLPQIKFASVREIGLMAVGLVVYHLVLYLVGFLALGGYKEVGPVKLMAESLNRVFIMIVSILFGVMMVYMFRSALPAVVFWTFLKIWIDLKWKGQGYGMTEKEFKQKYFNDS